MKPLKAAVAETALISDFCSEGMLIRSLKDKDESAFSYLYDHYAGTLYKVILDIVPDCDYANDVLQEVFTNIWRRIDTYDASKAGLFTWMFNIARNASISKLRSKGYKKGQRTTSLLPEYDYSDKGGLVIKLQEDAVGLRGIVSRLKPELKLVIDLFYFGGYTHELIADMTSIPLGTVKNRIRTGLKQMRALFY